MDATRLLQTQHDVVRGLFEAIEEAEENEEKIDLLEELADNLAAHTSIEEKLFYPAVYRDELTEQLHEAVEEHLAAKRLLADLLQMKEGGDTFDAKVKVLKEQIEHHVEEEEGELFEKTREAMTADDLESLGAQMEALFGELMEGSPRDTIAGETQNAAELPSS